tara:strand:+ start:3331 stop:3597 length:267 start_codon:yes stop_codon:yes gene_type:complete
MSALRQHAQDELDKQYNKLYEICKKDCQAPLRLRLRQLDTNAEKTCAEDIIGTKKEFRAKMTTDARYKNLAELLLRISPQSPTHLFFL